MLKLYDVIFMELGEIEWIESYPSQFKAELRFLEIFYEWRITDSMESVLERRLLIKNNKSVYLEKYEGEGCRTELADQNIDGGSRI
ncbi:MAG: hypothetical protein HQK65_02290 [Desulfamplus sp.]|nr:hypothetical protein [Desulfamplus sp.]